MLLNRDNKGKLNTAFNQIFEIETKLLYKFFKL